MDSHTFPTVPWVVSRFSYISNLARVDAEPAAQGLWSREDGLAGWSIEHSQVRFFGFWCCCCYCCCCCWLLLWLLFVVIVNESPREPQAKSSQDKSFVVVVIEKPSWRSCSPVTLGYCVFIEMLCFTLLLLLSHYFLRSCLQSQRFRRS